MTRTAITVAALAAIGLAVTAVYSHHVLDRFPNSADEHVYLFQADTLGQGRFWNPTHRLQPFFSFRHISERDGKWVGRFPPGWPGLMAAASAAGVPRWAVNPLLSGLSIAVLFLLARRLYGDRSALLAAATVLLSSFFIFNGASYFSHGPAALFALLFHYFGISDLEQERVPLALLSGLCIGCAFLIRPYTAVLVSAPLVAAFLGTVPWRRYTRGLWYLAGAAPAFLAYLVYNFKITGDPLLPVTIWADPREGIGFVSGHDLPRGIGFALRHLQDFGLWASPAVLLLLLPALWFAARSRDRWALVPGSVFVVSVLGYLLYRTFGGNQYGPRFYFEAYPFAVLAVVGLLGDPRLKPALRRLCVGLFATGLLFAIAAIPLHTVRERRVVEERSDLYRLVQTRRLENAIVLLSNGTGVQRPMPILDLTRNDIDLENDVLYGRDFGDRRNRMLTIAFPGRQFYRYSRVKGEVEGRLDPL